jgi:hypothetical protein
LFFIHGDRFFIYFACNNQSYNSFNQKHIFVNVFFKIIIAKAIIMSSTHEKHVILVSTKSMFETQLFMGLNAKKQISYLASQMISYLRLRKK